MTLMSAHMVRSLLLDLMTGTRTEAEVLTVLAAWLDQAGPSYRGRIIELIAAIECGVRRAELAAWRSLECAMPHGYPSETPVGLWRFDPITGMPFTRFVEVSA